MGAVMLWSADLQV